jgi:hypothetical protein
VLGTGVAMAQALHAIDSAETPHEGFMAAGAILAEWGGNLAGGIIVGGYSAAVIAGLLATPGVNVGVVAGAIIVGAAGFAGGYVGGEVGGALISDVYTIVADIGVVPFFQNLYDDLDWADGNNDATLEEYLAGLKTAEQLISELNVSNINTLLNTSGNEWMDDRKVTSNGVDYFLFHSGDEIHLPEISGQAVRKLGIGIGATTEEVIKNTSYFFYDSEDNLITPLWIDNNKIHSINNGSTAWDT